MGKMNAIRPPWSGHLYVGSDIDGWPFKAIAQGSVYFGEDIDGRNIDPHKDYLLVRAVAHGDTRQGAISEASFWLGRGLSTLGLGQGTGAVEFWDSTLSKWTPATLGNLAEYRDRRSQ